MTYETKLDAALAVIAQHNDSLGVDVKRLNAENFVANLKHMGGTSEATLASCTWEDLENCGLPRILARTIAGIFRVEDKKEDRIVVFDDDPEKQAKRLKPVQLVEHYDPEDSTNPYGERLNKAVKGLKVLIFDQNGMLHIKATQEEVERIRQDYPQRSEVYVEGLGLCKTYRIGERPGRYADMHPLYSNVPLNPDGTSNKGVNWISLPLACRQLIHLAINETKELKSDSYDEFDLFDIVAGKDLTHIGRRWPKAYVMYGEWKQLGKLPLMKIELGGGLGGGVDINVDINEKSNPFGVNRKF